jgi:hypothetical protein
MISMMKWPQLHKGKLKQYKIAEEHNLGAICQALEGVRFENPKMDTHTKGF